ncbi:MAG: hypothetical protein IT210_21895 [Armatimonadetes bacterium]|nr:hypothetical protein [Armatimonadota bacterium]
MTIPQRRAAVSPSSLPGGAPAPGQPEAAISPRALLFGLLLVPLNVYWVMVAELRWYVLLTLNPLFVTPVFYLFALVGLNVILRKAAPRLVLSRAELVVIYIMLAISCTIATHDFLINLLSTMPWARWYASPANGWETALFPHLPRWLLVWDKALLDGFFKGDSTLYTPAVLKMWLAPLAFWSLFIFCIGWIMLCMNVILRKAWVDQTRLSFPIVHLPMALTEEFSPGSTLRSPALWIGFAVAASISIVNGLHEWIPSMPRIAVGVRWYTFAVPPWSAAGDLPITMYPYAVGLAFLVPLDVSFSCWFFYLFMKVQSVLGFMAGYGSTPDFPYAGEQVIGAWFAFGGFLLYTNRRYLRHVTHLAFHPSPAEDAGEPMSYRVAFWGLVIGAAVFLVFWWAAGMSFYWALVAMLTYLLVSVCITRVRAEAGGQHTVSGLEPKNLFQLFDSNIFSPSNLGAAAVSHWYWRLNRSHIMPNQMEAFVLAQKSGLRLRCLVFPILASMALSIVIGMWIGLHLFYREGALAKCQGFATWTGTEAYNWLGTSLTSGYRAEAGRWRAIGGAAALIALLSALRGRFVGFPLHPLGYCIGSSLTWHWFPFFIAWLVKLLILRYGGLRFYHRALPFFLGLVLGDYSFGALLTLIGITWKVPAYQFEFF